MKTTLGLRLPETTSNRPGQARILLLGAFLVAGLAGALLGQPVPIAVDAHAVAGSISNVNGVLEPGETVEVDPAWTNPSTMPQAVTGTASNLTGLAGPTYTLNDSSAAYGTVGPGAAVDCHGATGNCYLMTVAGARPATHWDAVFTERVSADSVDRFWTLHVGNSFTDVPIADPFYPFIETIFHNGVTAGCNAPGTPPAYCMNDSVTRAQMAVFLLKGKLGASHVPPPATGTVFDDVHVGDFAADWIEELAGLGITSGCGNGNYCPNDPATRAQMAVFLLKSEHGSAHVPPTCVGLFADVPCPSTPDFPYSDWIEQLFNENITGGCSPAPPGGLPGYCPGDSVTRGEMAVFLVKAFGLLVYGPPRSPQTVTVTWGQGYECPYGANWFFLPATVHIRAGDTVTWVWPGGSHSTTGSDWDSGVQAAPFSFSHAFAQPGTFPYGCTPGHEGWVTRHDYCYSESYHEGGTVIVDP